MEAEDDSSEMEVILCHMALFRREAYEGENLWVIDLCHHGSPTPAAEKFMQLNF